MAESSQEDTTALLQQIGIHGLNVLSQMSLHPPKIPFILEKMLGYTNDISDFFLNLLRHPEKLYKLYEQYCRESFQLFQQLFSHWSEGKLCPITDKRFQQEEWQAYPFFSLLSQQYLLAERFIHNIITNLQDEDNKTKKKLLFVLNQYLDALSPSNFLCTNPNLLAITYKTQGDNLLRGYLNFLKDMETNPSQLMISMSDTGSFKLGKNVAATPGQVIYKNELIELIQYQSSTQTIYSIPLLIVPPWINKYYILDLSPHNSLVHWLVKQGFTVFMISWRNPGEQHAEWGLADYVEQGIMSALTCIQKQTQAKAINTLGFCIGGTLLAMAIAFCKKQGLSLIHSATFLATLLDFKDPGDIGVFIDEAQIQQLEEKMQHQGYLEGQYMANTFNALRAKDLIWSFFIKNYLKGEDPSAFDLLYWNADSTNMPFAMHREYLRNMYLHNNLIKPNKIRLNNIPIDIHTIDIPTFFVATEKDHIAPWQSVYAGCLQLQGDKQFLLGESGHVAGIALGAEQVKYGYYYSTELPKQASAWKNQSRLVKQSWWLEWEKWLIKQSGKKITSYSLKHLPMKGLYKAPGKYVHAVSS